MYHFVRDLSHSRYPEIKGLTIDEFRGQVDYIQRHYQTIGARELLDAVRRERPLPARALLLTFDDGYRDHSENVLPILAKRGMTGIFFPPAKAVMEHSVLDVNKIHFVLASVADKAAVLDSLFELVDEARCDFDLGDRDYYENKLAHPNRFDTADVILIKRLLQRELPELLRNRITAELFQRFVTADEAAFSEELYMSVADLRAIQEAGMYVGSHGFDHYWLDSLSASSQAREVDLSLEFLRAIGSDTEEWIMGYPYGGYNDTLLGILKARGCAAGFTTEVRIADLSRDDPLVLPRIDTNDLPKRGDSYPNEWTMKVLQGEVD